MRPIGLVVVLTIVVRAAQAQAIDPVLVGFLRDLAGRAALKPDNLEVAAFLIVDDRGELTCQMWAHTANRASEHFEGAIPKGTVAIAHSHPYQMPQPSRADIALAQRLGLPVYVVSRWELHVADAASGRDISLLRGRDWTRAPAVHRCN